MPKAWAAWAAVSGSISPLLFWPSVSRTTTFDLASLDLSRFNVTVHSNLDDIIGDYDVIYMLRIQKERQTSGLIPSAREYTSLFGLTRDRVKRMKDGAVVMHPGPINRGVELDYEVADSDRSLILNQVTNGEAVRMAALFLLTGRSEHERS